MDHPLIIGLPAAIAGGAWLYGQLFWPLILDMAEDARQEPPPPPVGAPERDPSWCHSHGKPYPACAGDGGH